MAYYFVDSEEIMANYNELSDDMIRAKVRHIVTTSTTDEEIKKRIADELGYKYALALSSRVPTDSVGKGARTFGALLGGLVRQKDGAMVQLMMHGPRGNTISL